QRRRPRQCRNYPVRFEQSANYLPSQLSMGRSCSSSSSNFQFKTADDEGRRRRERRIVRFGFDLPCSPPTLPPMRIHFFGATRTTTGSMYLLEVNGQRVLLECGLFQGRRDESMERN